MWRQWLHEVRCESAPKTNGFGGLLLFRSAGTSHVLDQSVFKLEVTQLSHCLKAFSQYASHCYDGRIFSYLTCFVPECSTQQMPFFAEFPWVIVFLACRKTNVVSPLRHHRHQTKKPLSSQNHFWNYAGIIFGVYGPILIVLVWQVHMSKHVRQRWFQLQWCQYLQQVNLGCIWFQVKPSHLKTEQCRKQNDQNAGNKGPEKTWVGLHTRCLQQYFALQSNRLRASATQSLEHVS